MICVCVPSCRRSSTRRTSVSPEHDDAGGRRKEGGTSHVCTHLFPSRGTSRASRERAGKDGGLNKVLPLAPCYSCTVRFLSIFFSLVSCCQGTKWSESRSVTFSFSFAWSDEACRAPLKTEFCMHAWVQLHELKRARQKKGKKKIDWSFWLTS
jgi:hypothetical protein